MKPKDKLTLFIYLLVRDHVPAGVISQVMKEIETAGEGPNNYSNNNLMSYAWDVAEKLST